MSKLLTMGNLELHNPEFDIVVKLGGRETTISVNPAETTDGVEYFNCLIGSKQITQVRLDENQKWEQIWGELNDDEVNAIGKHIDQNK